MDKLQLLLDTAFGKPSAERVAQEPNDFTIQRQRTFDEAAKKIEVLRRARLARSATRH
jgi:hypothetical protein